MVVLPVFLQAPWVRVHPFSATLFTAVLVTIGVVLNRSDDQQKADWGSLIVGFSGSWLAGCVFLGLAEGSSCFALTSGSICFTSCAGWLWNTMAAGLRLLFVFTGGHSLHRFDDGRHRGDALLA